MYQNSDFVTIVNVKMQRYYVKMQKSRHTKCVPAWITDI